MDYIADLPDDHNSQPTREELNTLDQLFRDENTRSELYQELRVIVYAVVLHIIFSMPFMEGVLQSAIPICRNPITCKIMKYILFGVLLWVVMKTLGT